MITRKKRMRRFIALMRKQKKKLSPLAEMRENLKKRKELARKKREFAAKERVPSIEKEKTTLEELVSIEIIDLKTIVPEEIIEEPKEKEFEIQIVEMYPEEKSEKGEEKTPDVEKLYKYNKITRTKIMKNLKKMNITFKRSYNKKALYDLMIEGLKKKND